VKKLGTLRQTKQGAASMCKQQKLTESKAADAVQMQSSTTQVQVWTAGLTGMADLFCICTQSRGMERTGRAGLPMVVFTSQSSGLEI
jgi:hypothetical protein